MTKLKFITDNNGKKLAVVLPMKEYNKILEDLEDLEAYDKAINSKKEFIPLDKAIKEIEISRIKRNKL